VDVASAFNGLQYLNSTFRTIGDDRDVARILPEYVVGKLKAKRIAVVGDRTARGQTFSDAVVRSLATQGITSVDREYVTNQTVDFEGVLTQIKSTAIDVLIYAGVDTRAGPMRRQMILLGMSSNAWWVHHRDRYIRATGRLRLR
jgi:branched-chain amino acid transport system substrate-binding protein